MEVLFHILVVAEMLFVNLTTVHLCTKRRYSNRRTIFVLVLYSAVIIALTLFGLTRTNSYGNGNGLFVLIGFVYLIPLKYLYDENFSRLLEVICSAWIYTMLCFSLSVHIGKLLPPHWFAPGACIAQTVIYLISAWPFMRFIKDRFVFVLQNIPDRINKYLQTTSLMWFFTAVVVNYSYVASHNAFMRPVAFVALAVNALLSYSLLYIVVKSLKSIENLQKIINIDHLTGLGNRTAFYVDADRLMKEGAPFALIFLDLDQFKAVNDTYGHLAGDEYISQFAKNVLALTGKKGTLYRISGDEFILLYIAGDSLMFLRQTELLSFTTPTSQVLFAGVSYGCASFPEDADNLDALIRTADRRMYEQKKGKQETMESDAGTR